MAPGGGAVAGGGAARVARPPSRSAGSSSGNVARAPMVRSTSRQSSVNGAPVSRPPSRQGSATMRTAASSSAGAPASNSNMAAAPRASRTPASSSEPDDSAGKETNISVVVRCRGRNDREVKENSGVYVHTSGPRGRDVTVQTSPLSVLSNKTYSFDRVFGPEADQAMLFDDVAGPILSEVVGGFNCTIFAYGQTGTGKTYTMSGDISGAPSTMIDQAGIIPRTLHRLFQKLEAEEASEYSVKVSYIELYNEELRDLLAYEEDKKLKIYDDHARKGGVIINDMEETQITNAQEGLKLLQAGSHKRQVAATRCNDLSSRSHSVFTITVHVKEQTDGEDMLRVGKLNLVDLAGSENIGRSGAENKRAREAGMINQSLLTLGRVINSLVDHSAHIPYRESKLTRLLQDSLGGRTKTCIIATISPAKVNLEETISTLEYAARAKNIRNKPQCNQLMTKKTLIKEFVIEIERLKADLVSTRQKNGVFMTQESYKELTEGNESYKLLTDEQTRKIEMMDSSLRNTREQLELTAKEVLDLKRKNDHLEGQLRDTHVGLAQTKQSLHTTAHSLEQEKDARKIHEANENDLTVALSDLTSRYNETVMHIQSLQDKLSRKTDVQQTNVEIHDAFKQELSRRVSSLLSDIRKYGSTASSSSEAVCRLLAEAAERGTAQINAISSQSEAALALFEQQYSKHRSGLGNAKTDMDKIMGEITELRDSMSQQLRSGLGELSRTSEQISEEVVQRIVALQQQTHNSYSQIGLDARQLFDDTKRHMDVQASDIEQLRDQLVAGTNTAGSAIATTSNSLQTAFQEHRKATTDATEDMLQQIRALVVQQMNTQLQRIERSVDKTTEDHELIRQGLDKTEKSFVKGTEEWSSRQMQYHRRMQGLKNEFREHIVSAARSTDEQNEELQRKTTSINSESRKVVETQMSFVEREFSAMDEFVSRARDKTQEHFEAHVRVGDEMRARNSASAMDACGKLHRLAGDNRGQLEKVHNSLQNRVQFDQSFVAQTANNIIAVSTSVEEQEDRVDQATGNTPPRKTYADAPVCKLRRVEAESAMRRQAASPLREINANIRPASTGESAASTHSEHGEDSSPDVMSVQAGLKSAIPLAKRHESLGKLPSLMHPDTVLGQENTAVHRRSG